MLPNLFPATVAQVASDIPAGLLHGLQWPLALEAALLFLLLDCWYYWQHRIFHEMPLLWRAHLVHHSDIAIDVSSCDRVDICYSLRPTMLKAFFKMSRSRSTRRSSASSSRTLPSRNPAIGPL